MGGIYDYSIAASLVTNSSIENNNVKLLSKTMTEQYIQNEVDLDNGRLEITGVSGMFELNNFRIYESKRVGNQYKVTNIFSYDNIKKYIFLTNYDLSYDISDDENIDAIHNKIPIKVIYKSNIENNHEIIIRGIKYFYTINSKGTLLRYTTANPDEYKVDMQEVILYSENFVVDESKLTLNFDFTDTLGSVFGTVNIMDGNGTIADKKISPEFLDWFYGNYYAIALAVFSVIIGNFITKNGREKKNKQKMQDK